MKILLWDIENFPLLATTWTLFPKGPLDHKNLERDFSLISVAWKWFGESKVYAVAIDPLYPENDKAVVETVHAVISEADVIVGHNGDNFDLKKFQARAIKHGLPPLPPVATVDTLKVARKYFGFTSNRLDFLGDFLGVGRKIPTSYSLWLRILKGDADALAKMVKYNKQDVKLLEEVYKILRPYMRTHPNENLFKAVTVCPTCGSKKFTKRGFKYNRTTVRQQYQCAKPACRAWFSGEIVKGAKVA